MLAAAVSGFRPDLVVNAAAYTAVDKAEDEAEHAFRLNRDGAEDVAAGAAAARVPLIHLSTDYVYDGAKPSPYVETDAPLPIGVYGASKLAGEVAIAAIGGNYVILRTSWVCSYDGTISSDHAALATHRRNRGRGRSMGGTDLCRRSGRSDCFYWRVPGFCR